MGVRLAETMTTSWSDMTWNLWMLGSGAAARLQPVVKNCYERVGNLRTAHRLVLPVPVSNPVERSRECECGHFRIARMDGAVLYAFTDQPPYALVDFRLHGLDVAAHVR